MKTIKAIIYKNYSVELVENEDGTFAVLSTRGDARDMAGNIKDINLALSFFESTLVKMAGH